MAFEFARCWYDTSSDSALSILTMSRVKVDLCERHTFSKILDSIPVHTGPGFVRVCQ